MSLGVLRPPQMQQYQAAPSKGSNKWKNIGAVGLGVIGAAAGTLAAPGAGTALGLTAGQALAGATAAGLAGGGGGMALGNIIGGAFDKKPQEGAIGSIAGGAPQLALPENAASRRLSSVQADALSTYGQGLRSLAKIDDPELHQQAAPLLFQAYTSEYNKRQGVG